MSLRAGSPGGSIDRDDFLVNALKERVRECVGGEDFDSWFAGTPCRYDPAGAFIFTGFMIALKNMVDNHFAEIEKAKKANAPKEDRRVRVTGSIS